MISTVHGLITARKDQMVVIEVGGIGFKLMVPKNIATQLPSIGETARLFTYLHVREDALELYGFLRHEELELFERLISISGIGPKSGIGIIAVAPVEQIVAAINEGRLELLTRVSGVGKKTAERVILELKGKLTLSGATAEMLGLMESDIELEETLIALGYSRAQAKGAIAKIDPQTKDFKAKLKEALRYFKKT